MSDKADEEMLAQIKSYLQRSGYEVTDMPSFIGRSGQLVGFDFLANAKGRRRPVMVYDWRKTVGVNMIIKTDKASDDASLGRPIIIGSKFSDHARAYAYRRGIELLSIRDLGL